MKRLLWMVAFGVALSAMLAPRADAGRMYKYTDDRGQTHVVDDFNKVPAKYRDQMEKRIIHKAPSGAGPEGEEGAAAGGGEIGPPEGVDLTGLPPDIDPATVVGRDPKTGNFLLDPGRPERLRREKEQAEKLQKQQKLGQADKEGHDEAYWRKRIADCTSKARALQDEYESKNLSYQNSANFGIPSEAAKVEALRKRAQDKQKECERIPDEARKAGAPPGWVR